MTAPALDATRASAAPHGAATREPAARGVLIGPRVAFRTASRLLLAAGVLASGAIVLAVVALGGPARGRQRRLRAALAVLARGLLRAFGVHLERRGPAPRAPALLVANHLSWIDILAVLAHWPCACVAKREVAGWPLVGRLATAAGAIFVDRGRKRDLLRAIPAIERALRAGDCVLLFPEGTTTRGDGVLPFKSALFEAAVRAGAPVVPLALGGVVEDGAPHALCWTGSTSLLAHLPTVAAARRSTFTVQVGAAVTVPAPDRHARKPLARRAELEVRRRLRGVRNRAAPRRWSDAIEHGVTGGAAFVLALLVGVSVLYAACPWYAPLPAHAFTGAAWYNPYDGVPPDHGWRRANFHAHSVAWGGLTHGRQPPAEVVARYRAMGFDVVGLSNYHAPVPAGDTSAFPVYEHGWNLRKAHRLALAPEAVVWLDYPLGQSRHQRQHVLDRLRAVTPAVAIAHPALRDGHPPEALRHLAGYDLLEVLNHFVPPAEAHWDAALSAGRPVFLLANDDSHDIAAEGETGVHFTRIHAPDASPAAVVAALRAGRSVGVRGWGGRGALHLESAVMRGDTLTVRVGGPVTRLRAVGQEGVLRAERTGDAARDGVLRVVADPADGYLRVVAEGVDADGRPTALYLNPVLRWDGRALPVVAPVVDHRATLLWRGAWLALYALLAALLWRARRRPVPLPVPAPGPS